MSPSQAPALSKFSRPEASFARTHTGELEHSPPLSPLWHSWLAGLLTAVAIGLVLVML